MTETAQNITFNAHSISCTLHEAGSRNIVIFCHGFRGTSVGPNRFFVRAARQLQAKGVSSLRFDQFGSGNSTGDFFESSFHDWVKTIEAIAAHYIARDYRVALFGQSMGAAAAIAAAAHMPAVTAVVAWVPDPNIEDLIAPPDSVIEEGGQIVPARFWQEAHTARIADELPAIKAPVYIVQCTADEYVDQKNRDALEKKAQQQHKVENFAGYTHSSWSQAQATEIIDKSIAFLVAAMPKPVSKQTDAEKIAQILREERPEKGPAKPPFPYAKHLGWTVMSGGLWAPVWVVMSLMHDYKWRRTRK